VKTAQLQIRLTPAQKASLRRRARLAGQDISAYVLSRVAPPAGARFEEILGGLPRGGRFALAELHDFLADLPAAEFPGLPGGPRIEALAPESRNRVAAMVEQASARRGASPPSWVEAVPPLEKPVFASGLKSLRPHLLRVSPAPFRRRNLFVDSSIGDRV